MSEPVQERDAVDSGELQRRIGANLASIHDRIAAAALRSGREPGQVTLVAVSKTHPLSSIVAAKACGQADFGENRIEELEAKAAAAKADGIAGLRWHLIGPIQSRKSERAAGPVALIHAVDRSKIAERLSRVAIEQGRTLAILLEVNVSGEESKHGFTPEALRQEMAELLALPGVRIDGLMTMAPYSDDAETARPVFRALRLLRDELAERHGVALPQLSMGMSNDFEVAIEEGATLVRVGTAIFGARPQP